MRELALSARTQAIFDRIKSYAWTLNVYGMSSSRAEWLVKALAPDILRAIAATPFDIAGLSWPDCCKLPTGNWQLAASGRAVQPRRGIDRLAGDAPVGRSARSEWRRVAAADELGRAAARRGAWHG